MTIDLESLKRNLEAKGLSQETRNAIRSSKICIIDDKIEDLKSMTSSLRREGFSNLIELARVPSISGILNDNYDLVILDLGGVAEDLSKDDGYGVLSQLKTTNPSLPVLVVTGSTTPPNKVEILNMADLIRSKPVLPAELSADVEIILRNIKDEFWGALEILRELNKIDRRVSSDLSLVDKIKLHFNRKAVIKKLAAEDKNIVTKLINIARITTKIGKAAIKIQRIATALGA